MRYGLIFFCLVTALAGQTTTQSPAISAYIRMPGSGAPYPYKWLTIDPPLVLTFDAAGSPHIGLSSHASFGNCTTDENQNVWCSAANTGASAVMTAHAQVQTALLSALPMAPSLDPSSQSYTFNAQKTPAPNSIIFIMFRSSQVGEDYFTAVVVAAALTPKQIILSVKGTPHALTDADNVTLAYWSIEQ